MNIKWWSLMHTLVCNLDSRGSGVFCGAARDCAGVGYALMVGRYEAYMEREWWVEIRSRVGHLLPEIELWDILGDLRS